MRIFSTRASKILVIDMMRLPWRNWNTAELMAAELVYFIYDQAFIQSDFGYAAATTTLLLAIALILVAWQLQSSEAE